MRRREVINIYSRLPLIWGADTSAVEENSFKSGNPLKGLLRMSLHQLLWYILTLIFYSINFSSYEDS
jgi:hypothetical protein